MDREPQIRGWVALAVLALLAGLLIGAGFGAMRHEQREPAPSVPSPPPVAAAPATPASPPTPPVLRRSELLGLVSAAAARYSAGEPYSAEQKEWAGRRFELVTPFGCEGPTPTLSLDPAQVTVDANAKTLTYSAQPRDWSQTGWIKDIVGEGEFESVEGFWVPRPWQTSEACPVVREATAGEPPPTLAPPSVGVVQVMRSQDSRLAARAGRPFRLTKKATDEDLRSREVAAKFLISGRLAALPSGEVARCRSSSVDQWPVCLIGVQLDQVAFLSADGEVMAEWSLPSVAIGAEPAAEPARKEGAR